MRKIPAAVNTFFACGGTFLIAALPPMARIRLSARITTAMPDESIKLTPEMAQAVAVAQAQLPATRSGAVTRSGVGTSDELQIRHFDDLWVVEGPWLQRLMGTINFGDYESRMYFDRVLRQSGLFDRLEAMGIEEGDTVSIYDLDFEFRF